MAYLVLARKYRPRRFEEVVGQEAIAQTLKNAIETGRVAHAYLFTGQRGVGKTTMARILASALNCAKGPTPEPCGQCDSCRAIARGDDLDVVEIDGASHTGVDNIRELRSNARYAPARSRFKIYYVDEVHMLSRSAFNALLKTLEEPPEHVKFIFSTTEPHRVPETIHSRCQRFDFRSISPDAIARRLGEILEAEGVRGDEAVLEVVARRARGSLRDALSLLDQLISATGSADDLAALQRLLGLAEREQVEAMMRAFLQRDPAEALRIVERLVEEGRSLGEFLNLFTEHLRAALLVAVGAQPPPELAGPAVEEMAKTLPPQQILYALQLCGETLRRLGRVVDQRLPVEITLVKLCIAEPLVPLSDLVDRLERLGGGEAAAGDDALRGGTRRDPEPTRNVNPAPSTPSRTSPAPERGARVRKGGAEGGVPRETSSPKPTTADGKWSAALETVAKSRKRIAALLRMGRIVSLGGEELVLGFAPEHRSLVEHLSEADTRELVERAMAEAFGRRIRLQLVVVDPSMEENGGPSAREVSSRELTERALADPVVRSAMDLFGARLVRARPLRKKRTDSGDPTGK